MTSKNLREGPAFRRTPNGSIEEGWWTEDPEERLESRLSFQLVFGLPERTPDAERGYYVCSTPSKKAPPGTWNPIHSCPPFDELDPDAIYLMDPDSVSPVRVLSWAQRGAAVVLDLRDCSRWSPLYHTFPVTGWIQTEHQRPPTYQPRTEASARMGTGPLWWFQHGFTGGPDNWDLVRDHLDQGPWSWIIPLLPGHGLPKDEFGDFGCDEWVDAVRTLGEWTRKHTQPVVGVGLSMGGALMLRCWEQFDAIVLINTPIHLPDWRRHFLPLLSMFRSYYYPDNSEKVIPVSSLLALRRLLRENRPVYPDVDRPVLILNHKDDETVPPEHGVEMQRKLPRAERHLLPGGPHEATENPEALPDLFRVIGEWAEDLPFKMPELHRFRSFTVE